MAKFSKPADEDDPLPINVVPPTTTTVNVSTAAPPPINIGGSSPMASTQQAQSAVGLAQASIDADIAAHQMAKEDEHWVKAYWRPAMGWLYMAICFCDFIVFPMLTMFLPVIEKGFGVNVGYVPWVSLTLSNGGMIHVAFGAILGVAAYTRGQEKIAKI
jgi:Holin of 3TMs, for gene-transfer release